MIPSSELRTILGQYFPWNKARLTCFTQMLLALFTVRTVNLREWAVAFADKARVDSRYKRIKRFFAYFSVDTTLIARSIFALFFAHSAKLYLTLDRTNWFWGKAKINLLMLGAVYEGIAIPLFWMVLPKAGNASAQGHIAIVKRFVDTFGKPSIAGVLGDREFGSGKFFRWLNQQHNQRRECVTIHRLG